jgi:hypothetical protein
MSAPGTSNSAKEFEGLDAFQLSVKARHIGYCRSQLARLLGLAARLRCSGPPSSAL